MTPSMNDEQITEILAKQLFFNPCVYPSPGYGQWAIGFIRGLKGEPLTGRLPALDEGIEAGREWRTENDESSTYID